MNPQTISGMERERESMKVMSSKHYLLYGTFCDGWKVLVDTELTMKVKCS